MCSIVAVQFDDRYNVHSAPNHKKPLMAPPTLLMSSLQGKGANISMINQHHHLNLLRTESYHGQSESQARRTRPYRCHSFSNIQQAPFVDLLERECRIVHP